MNDVSQDKENSEPELDKITALNTLILNYYKKIGRKKDLEKYFSLSTVEGEARDPSSVFWKKLKMQNDSSDSGGHGSGSSKELCRISIKCTIPEPCSSQDDDRKSESLSPPIITEVEELPTAAPQSDEESIKSDDLQKSMDATHDMSSNKPVSPTSSINSQRKLEWDSLADVGYTNESDKKTSASSYSTLERLAFKPHYIENESKDAELGDPNAHSTLAEVHHVPSSKKKSSGKKTIELKNKDIDTVEFNVPHSSQNLPPINLNLTKHISFNMDKGGEVTVDKMQPDAGIEIPAKVQTVSVETVTTPVGKEDKQIQTSIIKSTDDEKSLKAVAYVPYYVSLKSIKKRLHKKRSKVSKKSSKRKTEKKEELFHERSGEPVSEAESFEYMPGHIYNQNQLKVNLQKSRHSAGNKSSLESSGGITTESSKTSNSSFAKDLDKSVEHIQNMLQNAQNDPKLKKKLIKQLVQKLLSTRYQNDKSTSDLISALSTNSKVFETRLGHTHSTTTSNSDANYSDQPASSRPKKSILRVNRFDQDSIACSSQSAPNLPLAAVGSRSSPRKAPIKKTVISTSHTESDISSKGRESDKSVSDLSITELCRKYLETIKKEDIYKKYLGEKEKLIKQKLAKAQSRKPEQKLSEKFNRIKELMNDLVRNNYDDGSGDASNIEARNANYDPGDIDPPRSHSLFTLSSGNVNRGDNTQNRIEREVVGDCLRQACSNSDRHQIHCYPYHTTEFCASINKPCYCQSFGQMAPPMEPVLVRTTQGMPESGIPTCPPTQPPVECPPELKFECVSFPQKQFKKEKRFSEMLQPAATYFSTPYDRNERKGNRNDYTSPSRRSSPSRKTNPKKYKPTTKKLIEHTKRIQTEISINPKISDPSLSDICVVKEDNCVEEAKVERDLDNISSGSFSIILKQVSLADKNTGSFICGEDLCDVGVQSNADDAENIFADSSQGFVFRSCIDVEVQKNVNDIKDSNQKDAIAVSEKRSLSEEFQKSCQLDIECACDDEKSQQKVDDDDCVCELDNPPLAIVCEEEPVYTNEAPKPLTTKYNTYPYTEKTSIPRTLTAGSISKTVRVVDCYTNTEIELTSCMGDVQVESQSEKSNIETPKSDKKSLAKIDSESSKCSTLEMIKDITRRYDKKDCDKLKRKSCFKEIMNVLNYLLDTEDSSDGGNNSKPSECDPEFVKYKDVRKRESLQPSQRSLKTKGSISSVGAVSKQSVGERSLASTRSSPRKAAKQKEPLQTRATTSKQSMYRPLQRESLSPQVRQSKLSTGKKSPVSNCSSPREYINEEDEPPCVQSKSNEKAVESMCSVYTQAGPSMQSVNRKNSASINPSPREVSNESQSVQVSPQSQSKYCMEKKVSVSTHTSPRELVDKGVSCKRTTKTYVPDSSDFPDSSDMHTSTDTATCKILDRIKKECERYHHQRKCKCAWHCNGKKHEVSSSTSVNCEHCRDEYRNRHCKSHKSKCEFHRAKAEKSRKKSGLAYNLVIQTTDSVASIDRRAERPENKCKSLKNIVVKVPRKTMSPDYVPFKETATRINDFQCTRQSPEPQFHKSYRSKSLPDESDVGSTTRCYTVRDYLEKNRPDFIEKAASRQNCLKVINESRSPPPNPVPMRMVVFHASPKCCPNSCQGPTDCFPGVTMTCRGNIGEPDQITRIDKKRSAGLTPRPSSAVLYPGQAPTSRSTTLHSPPPANERAVHRKLLLLQLERSASLNDISGTDVRHLARELGLKMRRKEPPPKFTSERAMKKHSEKIYKSLPEVVQKKEEIKKEKIKKTNLLMANIFKKNLQRKTLRGSVNLSNYSTVIKI